MQDATNACVEVAMSMETILGMLPPLYPLKWGYYYTIALARSNTV